MREVEPKLIPGYGDKYRVYPDGRVYRGEANTEVPWFDDPPRVCLYRLGKRWQPRVATLVERLFGSEGE
jgi:hypothetical protein